MMTMQFKTRRLFVCLLSVNLLWPFAAFAASQGDDFNDNVKNPSKWGQDRLFGHGVLTEKNQRLEYTCASPFVPEDDASRPWVLTRFPYNADWEMQIDTFNNTLPNQNFQVNSAGLTIHSPRDGDTEIYIEMYNSHLGGPPARTGFNAQMVITNENVGGGDTGDASTTSGALRLKWDNTNKVITCYYDAGPADDYQWVEIASFGLAGSGGATANGDWGMSGTDQFSLTVYGYSAGMIIPSGQMYMDNFRETGGVTPTGGPPPEPTGRFPFAFPTNNPLLTAIINLTGNYTGVTPTFVANDHSRTYNMDVAQDESGKLAVMGMIDGLANTEGGNELSGSLGSVVTVNDKPTVQLKTSFTGTGDGIPATARTTGSSPAEITDMGGGSNAVAVTLNISAKAAGVPFRLKNAPVMFPADSSYEANLKKSWTIDLDISRKTIKNKERTVASAQLLLPNGDTIAYTERVVRYSATKGYLLSFKRGTNVTVSPARIDKKSSISIKNLTFVQQGDDWAPTGGAITYQFLGQKGTANLLDFVSP